MKSETKTKGETMATRTLTERLTRYLQTHFSIVGFIDGPTILTCYGAVNQAGPHGIQIEEHWYDWEKAYEIAKRTTKENAVWRTPGRGMPKEPAI